MSQTLFTGNSQVLCFEYYCSVLCIMLLWVFDGATSSFMVDIQIVWQYLVLTLSVTVSNKENICIMFF